MNVSSTGLDFIKKQEGKRNLVYKGEEGLLTIGVGHVLTREELMSGKLSSTSVKWRNGLTDAQVDTLFSNDVEVADWCVGYNVKTLLAQNQFDALVSLAFNIGPSNFRRSTLLKMLNMGYYDAVPEQMRRWVYVAGKVSQVLVKRRASEIAMWEFKDG